MNSLISPPFIPVFPPLRYLYFQRISIMFKLVIWATLVFFSYGSQLQIGTALLLCVGRLALHAQFEPYRMTMDNAFDYVTLTITALFGLGGIMLQSMETFKNFAIYRGDERGSEASKSAISVVETALNIMVVAVFVAFAVPARFNSAPLFWFAFLPCRMGSTRFLFSDLRFCRRCWLCSIRLLFSGLHFCRAGWVQYFNLQS